MPPKSAKKKDFLLTKTDLSTFKRVDTVAVKGSFSRQTKNYIMYLMNQLNNL